MMVVVEGKEGANDGAEYCLFVCVCIQCLCVCFLLGLVPVFFLTMFDLFCILMKHTKHTHTNTNTYTKCTIIAINSNKIISSSSTHTQIQHTHTSQLTIQKSKYQKHEIQLVDVCQNIQFNSLFLINMAKLTSEFFFPSSLFRRFIHTQMMQQQQRNNKHTHTHTHCLHTHITFKSFFLEMNQNWKWFDVGFRMVDMNDNDDDCQRLFSALFLN